MANLLHDLTRAEALEVLERLAADMAAWIEALPSRRNGDPDVGHKIERLREQRAAVRWAAVRLRRAPLPKPQASSLNPLLTGAQVWASWIEVNRAAGRADPVKVGPDLAAAAALAEILPADQAERVLRAYLADTDPWLVKQGHPLRLVQQRINAYLDARAAAACGVAGRWVCARCGRAAGSFTFIDGKRVCAACKTYSEGGKRNG
jgi:hypothetical protein